MAFVDEITIYAQAGRGGNGVVRWLHLKGKEFSGPSGGNGGRGGDVFVRGIRDVQALSRYTHRKKFFAENGESGRKSSQEGKSGKDLFLELPAGSVITNTKTEQVIQILEEGQTEILLKGGKGGLGNEHFKSSTNVRPEEWTPGQDGDSAQFQIELQLIVDAGLVGLPNAGKSTLLNELTGARSKVGMYQFTTLDPFLGSLYGFILADVPGLIEGASKGKGLGHKFLRHIKRTRVILHCVSSEHEDVSQAYKTIRKELDSYSKDLSKKKEIIILTKVDMISPSEAKKRVTELKKFNSSVLSVTALDDDLIKKLGDNIVKILRED